MPAILFTMVGTLFVVLGIVLSLPADFGTQGRQYAGREYGPGGAYQQDGIDEHQDHVTARLESASLVSNMSMDQQLHVARISTQFLFTIGEHERRVYSQNSEDGVLEYIFANMGTRTRYYVEFGVEDGSQCNTRLLWEQYQWTGLLMDASGRARDQRTIRNHLITPDNIVSLLQRYGVPLRFDLLSVDLDSNDFYVATRLMDHGYRPRVVVQEINRNWGIDESFVVASSKHLPFRPCSSYWGMSQLAAQRLYRKYGYVMVYVERAAVNAFFIDSRALVEHMHETGARAVTEDSMWHTMVPTYESVYRHQPTTLCQPPDSDAAMAFRTRDLSDPAQIWARVDRNGNIRSRIARF